MKVLFTGGGTGGHVYPAIAMAEIIRSKYPDAEFAFIGRRGGDENSAIIKEGIPLYTVNAEGLSRRLTPKNLMAILKAIRAIGEARRLIGRISPDIVIGTGGYVTWPVIKAAAALKLPTMVHESNAYPGLATRMLSGCCDMILLGFEEAAAHLKRARAVRVVGTPVRSTFSRVSRIDARRSLGLSGSDMIILSYGGSLGSEKMNSAIPEVIERIERQRYRITHIHATGKRHYGEVSAAHPKLKRTRGSRIVPYIEDLPLWLIAADLAIARSGAITLAELSAARLPSILIPSPNVADDHQLKNARIIADSGRGILMEEDELSAGSLFALLERLYKDRAELAAMREAIEVQGRADADAAFLSAFESCFCF